MSVNPSLRRRKGPGNRGEKEVPECVAPLDGCPPFLKGQFINYTCVSIEEDKSVVSLYPWANWKGNWKALCDSQILSRPLEGLVCTKTLQNVVSGCGMPPRMQRGWVPATAPWPLCWGLCMMCLRGPPIRSYLLHPGSRGENNVGANSWKKVFWKGRAWVQAEFLAGIILAKWHFDRLAATQKQCKERRK